MAILPLVVAAAPAHTSTMTYLMLFLVVAMALCFESVRLMVRDGRGPQRPPISHLEDPRFRSPAAG